MRSEKPCNAIFEEAKNGGRHSGTYKQGIKKTDAQLRKSIKSYELKIKEHLDKIKNPAFHDANWDIIETIEKKGKLKHWKKELRNFTEEAEILKKIERGRNSE